MSVDALMLVPILLPLLCGLLLYVLNPSDERVLRRIAGGAILLCALASIAVLAALSGHSLTLGRITDHFAFSLSIDRLGATYGLLVAALWLLSVSYAFGYMRGDPNINRFFALFIASMGISMGVSMASNPLTFYVFYEFLTFFTYPLLTHAGTPEAMAAGRKYLVHAFIGASLVFVAMAGFAWLSGGAQFVYGGAAGARSPELIRALFAVGFLGFGVKAAVFPLHGWLPSAHVAPTPVTAMMHAVSVVKAGVLGIMRLGYFVAGAEMLRGSWAQYLCLALVCATILYGSTRALREHDLKIRLAYSTMAQLSCMLLPTLMFTAQGLEAGALYMTIHAIMKYTLFLCCGAIMLRSGRRSVRELAGIGRVMPRVMACFTIASLGIVGIPLTSGFISKWALASAVLSAGNIALGAVLMAVVMVSMLLSALYLLPLCVKAFAAEPGGELLSLKGQPEAPLSMLAPMALLAVCIVLLGIFPGIWGR